MVRNGLTALRGPSLLDSFLEVPRDSLMQRLFEGMYDMPKVSKVDEGIELEAEFPGFPKESIKVTLEENVLSMVGNYEPREGEKISRSYTMNVPHRMRDNEIESTYENGLLKVLIKSGNEDENYSPRQIEIK